MLAVDEVGDGNINFVYILSGPSGQLCLKQALPFVRCVGEGWPLTQVRVIWLPSLAFACSLLCRANGCACTAVCFTPLSFVLAYTLGACRPFGYGLL